MTLKDKEFLWHYGRSISRCSLLSITFFPQGLLSFISFAIAKVTNILSCAKTMKATRYSSNEKDLFPHLPTLNKVYHHVKIALIMNSNVSYLMITPREDMPPFGLKPSKRLISSHQQIRNRSQMLTYMKAIPVWSCITDLYKRNRVKVLNSRHT